jgi:phospholipid/cholesterol/gamma-HCH transport system substrate-binding protein
MAKTTSTVKIGIFIFLGVIVLVIGIFMIGDKRALFSSTMEVKAYFNDIQGLRSGATVRLSGIDVGTVKNVSIVDDTTGRVEVLMNIRYDVARFIRTDTRATIETEGLVGNKVIVLRIGTAAADPVYDGGVILSQEPVGFAEVIEETQGIMQYTKELTKDLSEIVARVNRGEGSIGKLLVDEQLYEDATHLTKRAGESLESITDEVQELTDLFNQLGKGVETVVNNVNAVVSELDTIVIGVKEGKGALGSMLVEGTTFDSVFTAAVGNIEKTTYDARLAASRLAENMEALKHNWLFKSYFENRGYWDKAEFEDEIDSKIKELNVKIRMLDERIETLKALGVIQDE